MGFGTRLKNGFKAFSQNSSTERVHRGAPRGNLNIHDMQAMLEAQPFGGLSQPVWGTEISTVGAYSREGYTSRSFDQPAISFRQQAAALQVDEDVQLAVNHLSAQVTGGSHYVKAKTDELVEYFEDFTRRLQFDIFDTEIVRELLWYGNSVYKPRLGIQHIRSADDLMHIPISSFVRVWWDRQRVPYKLEFRGAEYQGYHNPSEVLHFVWNPVDASAFGTGFGVSMTSPRFFTMQTPAGAQEKVLPPLLERKYATSYNMQLGEQRYVSRNVWSADGASEDERAALQSAIENLEIGQDVVSGTKVEVQELGSQSKNFNAEQFMDITQAPIMKALNDFRGKEGGSSQHSYANAKESAILDEVGLSSFPIAIKTQLEEKIFKPWYEAHPMVEMSYLGGMIPVPWEETNFEIDFGEVEKKDIELVDQIKLIELYMNSGQADPVELRKLFEQAGLGLTKAYDDVVEQAAQQGLSMNAGMGMPQGDGSDPNQGNGNASDNFQEELLPVFNDMGGGEVPPNQSAADVINAEHSLLAKGMPEDDVHRILTSPDFSSGTTAPPMDNEVYNAMMRNLRGETENYNPQPLGSNIYKRGNQSQDWNNGRDYE